LNLAGVVLNMVAGERHLRIAQESIEDATGVPVLGSIPRLRGLEARERHLGLVTVEETEDAEAWPRRIAAEMEGRLDLDRILAIAGSAPPVAAAAAEAWGYRAEVPVRIGVIRDSAFPFYYQENLEALTAGGAELIWIRALDDRELPAIDALYIGGGFPETHGARLAGNRRFKESLQRAARDGLPIYAECGGAVYLGRSLCCQGTSHEMAGVLPLDFEFCPRPQGHGYTEWLVDGPNPFYPEGAVIRGHEFHYTRVRSWDRSLGSICAVKRGVGFKDQREGIRLGNVVAFYGHVHALGCREWSEGLLRAAVRRSREKGPKPGIELRRNTSLISETNINTPAGAKGG